MRLAYPLVSLLALSLPLGAGEKTDRSEALAKTVAPFVDGMTILVGHADARRLEIDPLFNLVKGIAGKDRNLEEARAFLSAAQQAYLKAGGRDVFFVLNWDAPRPDQDILLVLPLPAKEENQEFIDLLGKVPHLKSRVQGGAILLSTARNLERMKHFKAKERPGLAAALASFGDDAAKLLLLPPPIVVRTLVEVFPHLPEEFDKRSTRELGRQFQWAGVGIGAEKKLRLTVRLQTADEKAARVYLDLIKKALDAPLHHVEVQLLFPDYVKMRDRLVPEVKGSQLVLSLDEDLLRSTLGVLAKKSIGSAARAQSANNMKQIGLAFHAFHDIHKAFPPAAATDAKGRALLSWRVYLLPYLEQDHLFKQFRLDEPWDSAHNKKLIEMIPPVYRSPLAEGLPPGKTTYLVPTGPETIFAGAKGATFRTIADGTSNTIMLLETIPKKAVFWTQPEDFPFDQKDLLSGLVQPELKGFHALFADGSVRWLSGGINPKTLRALITASGGEAIGPDEGN